MARDRDKGRKESEVEGTPPDGTDEGKPVRLPLADVLDLHAFAPSDVTSVLEEFLIEAARAGFRAVRVIHGKGMGIQRARVRALFAHHPGVLSFRDGPPEAGGWGSTVALLDPSRFPSSPPGGKSFPPVPVPRKRRKVLFLCTGNACRSQMAEGFARALAGRDLEPYSAGVYPSVVHPLAAKVMAEAGVDISLQYSKHVEELHGVSLDWVVTLCDYADEACPEIPGAARWLHHPFEDPVRARGTEEQVLEKFREVRDAIRAFVEGLPGRLSEEEGE